MMLLWILLGVVSRLMLHVPDATPLTGLCLFAPSVFSKRRAFLVIALILVLSDLGLHYWCGYPAFGYWTLFTYSGWMGVILLGFLLINKISLLRGICLGIISSLAFWVWTNWGVWCTSNFYAHNMQGLMMCYEMALPFLRNMMVSAGVTMGVIYSVHVTLAGARVSEMIRKQA